jgi:hypothetical protein
MLKRLASGRFTWKTGQEYAAKQKQHQRHNLKVMSWLPVARSGAVGYEVIY